MKRRIYIGVVPVVLLKLLDTKAHAFSGDELLVIEAIRRSDKGLTSANIDQNVKGIYHEIKFADLENTDGDMIEAELYELTNHPGSDVRLINAETGAVTDLQLKATSFGGNIAHHVERYPEIGVRATDEIAGILPNIESSGFSNTDLTNDVSATVTTLTESGSYIESAVVASGLLSAVANAKAALEGKQTRSAATRKTLEDLGVAGASAAIIELLVG